MPDDDDFESLIATPREIDRALGRNAEAVNRAARVVMGEDENAQWEHAALLAGLNAARELLRREAAENGEDVLVAPADPIAALLQSFTIEYGARTGRAEPLPAGGLEVKFEDGIAGRDVGWGNSLIETIRTTLFKKPHAVKRPAEDRAGKIPGRYRVALLSDWGTALYGAPKCSEAIAAERAGFDLVMHLGDVYYSGTEKEMLRRFLKLWPHPRGAVSRALNGNHEMYSSGEAYFDLVLPEFEQESSYFALQNDHWLLIALDTAHLGPGHDHDLDLEQVRWCQEITRQGDSRRIILFSHHQPYSILSGQGPNLRAKLLPLLASGRVFAWYWGHEHRCVLYDADPQHGFLGRCIGHSGIPYLRTAVLAAPVEESRNGAEWRRIRHPSEPNVPEGLILDGPNPDVHGKASLYGPNGYLTLELDGATLHETVHLPDGTIVRERELVTA
jgi:calcineurin-like phosphoesterase family protein